MSITDKTRKVLWGRSGNLCAFCKTHLVVDASMLDSESVVGDECHIISGAPNGPRHDPSIPAKLVDDLSNLLLLCRVHHKLVDDQPETFSAEMLLQLRANHEAWVKERLSLSDNDAPLRIIRSAADIPSHLVRITSSRVLLDTAIHCHGRYYDYPDDLSESDLDTVGALLQNLTDWVDLGLDEPHERISAQRALAENLLELDQAGLRIYLACEKQQLRGGGVVPSAFNILHLRVVRQDDPAQFSLEPGEDC